jgi:hypothetical protein
MDFSLLTKYNIDPYTILDIDKNSLNDINELKIIYKHKSSKITDELDKKIYKLCYNYILKDNFNTGSGSSSSSVTSSSRNTTRSIASNRLEPIFSRNQNKKYNYLEKRSLKNTDFEDTDTRKSLFVNHTNLDYKNCYKREEETKKLLYNKQVYDANEFKLKNKLFTNKKLPLEKFNAAWEAIAEKSFEEEQQEINKKVEGCDSFDSSYSEIFTYNGLMLEKEIDNLNEDNGFYSYKKLMNIKNVPDDVLSNLVDDDKLKSIMKRRQKENQPLSISEHKKRMKEYQNNEIEYSNLTKAEAEKQLEKEYKERILEKIQKGKNHIKKYNHLYDPNLYYQAINGELEDSSTILTNGNISVPRGIRKK